MVAIDEKVYDRDDAALTYSHADKCFYVVHVPGAAQLAQAEAPSTPSIAIFAVEKAHEGNITYKKLSPEHQAEFDKSKKKKATH